MNGAPSSEAALPFSRSGPVNKLGRMARAMAMAMDGTIPAHMTVAMIRRSAEPHTLRADTAAVAWELES